MKVLMCAFACLRDPDRRFGFGEGGETSLGWNIAKQVSRFHKVWVLTDWGNKEDIEKALIKEVSQNMEFCYIGLPKWLNYFKIMPGGIQVYSYLWQIKAYFVARKINKKINFNVFHHVTYANDWMASYIGALLKVPYLRGPGGGAHSVPRNFVKEYPFKDRLAQKARSIGQWFFRHDPSFIIGQNKARAILVCNQEAFDALPEKWRKKTYFFPVNGISVGYLSLLSPRVKEDNGHFIIFTAGKLIKIKGFDLAIKAFKIFSSKRPKGYPEAKLVIAGEGPELDNLKRLVKDLELENNVIFEGWIPRERLLKEMITCDIFLFPSLRDGGGNVVVEAMAAGRPVVCLNIAGPGFHIDEKCGIKIKSENPEQAIKDIAKALEKLYLDKDLRKKLGQGARQKAENVYNWDKLGDRLNEIYKKNI